MACDVSGIVVEKASTVFKLANETSFGCNLFKKIQLCIFRGFVTRLCVVVHGLSLAS